MSEGLMVHCDCQTCQAQRVEMERLKAIVYALLEYHINELAHHRGIIGKWDKLPLAGEWQDILAERRV